MARRTYLSVDRRECDGGIQISIGAEDADGSGHGYRMAGPKYDGRGKTLLKHYTTERDAREIEGYLRPEAKGRLAYDKATRTIKKELVMSTLTVVQGDDWEGIYIDGKLVAQGHSIPLRNGIDLAIQHKVTEVVWRAADLDWLHDVGELPDNLADAQLDPV